MRKCRASLAFLIVLALAAGASAYAATSPAAGSFLKYRANSVQALVKQVSSEKIVGDRYAQHFKVSRHALAEYFQDNLKLSTLRRPTVTTVYYINKSGKVVKGKRLLPTGTAVFMTKTGDLVLDWRCGNPLRASLPEKKIAEKKSQAASSASATPKAAPKAVAAAEASEPVKPAVPAVQPPVVERVLPSPPTEIAALPLATSPAVVAQTVAPAIVTAAPAVAPPMVEAVAAAPTVVPPVIASAHHSFNFLLPIAALGGIGAALGAGGGGHSTPPATPVNPVPEPSGLVALATGIMGAAGCMLRRRNR